MWKRSVRSTGARPPPPRRWRPGTRPDNPTAGRFWRFRDLGQPTGDGKAAIASDFVLIAKEVNPVMKALRDNGIEVTAVHNHMLDVNVAKS